MSRVLIVEDEVIIGTHLQHILRESGHEIEGPVTRGEDVQPVAEMFRPEVVLMDIHLAGRVTGTQAAAKLVGTMDVAIVYLTAFADDQTLAEAQKASPYGYLVKPFEPETVRTTVEVVGSRLRRDIENLERRALEAEMFEEWSIPVAITDREGIVRSHNAAASVFGSLTVGAPLYGKDNASAWQNLVQAPLDAHVWQVGDESVDVTARLLGGSILVTLARPGIREVVGEALRKLPIAHRDRI